QYQREFDSDSTVSPQARSSVASGVLPAKNAWPAAVPLADKGQPLRAQPVNSAAPPSSYPSRAAAWGDQNSGGSKKRLNYNRRR
ncbi:MAG: hypothetical protein HKN82_15665, partial [Akkermansiaceae bacterium]|nr:hypothetical protein [Akkermansiaceae bacterium]